MPRPGKLCWKLGSEVTERPRGAAGGGESSFARRAPPACCSSRLPVASAPPRAPGSDVTKPVSPSPPFPGDPGAGWEPRTSSSSARRRERAAPESRTPGDEGDGECAGGGGVWGPAGPRFTHRGVDDRALTSLLAAALPLACDLGQGPAPAESRFPRLHRQGFGGVRREVTSVSLGSVFTKWRL